MERSSVLPNFLIIGAMKAGTTSLYAYLREHPDVFMPANKEPNFFSVDTIWQNGVTWYTNLFEKGRKNKARGEASASYSKFPQHPGVPQRIQSMLPDVKLIYMLRSPVERIYSHYVHNLYAGYETESLEQVIFSKPGYVNASKYYMQLEQYLKYFSPSNILPILLDDLAREPETTVSRVLNFIGVDSSVLPDNLYEKKHVSSAKKGKDTGLLKAVKQMSCYHVLANMMPEQLKNFVSIFLKETIAKPEPISAASRNRLVREVSEDIAKLAEYMDRDLLKLWNLYPEVGKKEDYLPSRGVQVT